MMKIQKYKAKILGSDKIIVGYITETRKFLGNGQYDSSGTSYIMSVTYKSMPDGHYGTWLVDENTIEEVN